MVHVLSGWCVLRMAVSVLSSVAHLSMMRQSTPLPLTTVLTVDLSLEHVWLMRSGALRQRTLLKVNELQSPFYRMYVPAKCTLYIERTDFFANNVHVCISVCDGPFPVWNIILITLGVIFFIVGVIIAIILVLLLLKNFYGKFVHVCGHMCV